jgi:hypothetical protein
MKIVNFVWNRKKIDNIIRAFHELEQEADKTFVMETHNEIKKFVKSSFIMDAAVGFTLSLTVLVLSKNKAFVIPVLYSDTGILAYYPLYALQYLQVYGIGSSSVAVESILTISLMMLQAQIVRMKNFIADSKELKGQELKRIVDFHIKITR